MLLVYCKYITPRIEYALEFMLKSICGINFQITNNKNYYLTYDGPTINYSNEVLRPNDLEFIPNGLLVQNTIIHCNPIFKKDNDHIELIFKTESLKPHFDIFAASFYLITRYEEYLPYEADFHDRYKANDSILFKYDLLLTPVIDNWGLSLNEIIIAKYPLIEKKRKAFKSLITIDVDQAFAFRYRGIKRNILSFLKNSAVFNITLLKNQYKVLFKSSNDPFDSFLYLKSIQEKTNLPFIYFFNVGNYSNYDKNLSISNLYFKNLITGICSYANVGLHPSYFSNVHEEYLGNEKKNLSAVLNKEVSISRQHYLKLNLPSTYRKLIKFGIKEDYSMGYATHPGFRAGTCTPFLWFDLLINECTTLKIYPVTFMEGSVSKVVHGNTSAACDLIKQLTNAVKNVNGLYISIWHNHTVNNSFGWEGWQVVFEDSLNTLLNLETKS